MEGGIGGWGVACLKEGEVDSLGTWKKKGTDVLAGFLCLSPTPPTDFIYFFRVRNSEGLDPGEKEPFYLRGHLKLGAPVAELVPRSR